MPYIKLPDGTEIGVSLEDIILAIRMLLRNNTPYLTYDADRIISFYAKNSKWLAITLPSGELKAPYINEVDFRSLVPPRHWGTVSCVESFEFPPELQAHRAKMIAKFEAEKKLKKGNRPCHRVRSFSQTDFGEFRLEVQKAWYFDQVGTNLTLDYPFDQAMVMSGAEVRTVREWDLLRGKPQFFLQVQSRLSLNEIQDRMYSDYAEFTGQMGVVARSDPKLSPELLAFSILVGMPSST